MALPLCRGPPITGIRVSRYRTGTAGAGTGAVEGSVAYLPPAGRMQGCRKDRAVAGHARLMRHRVRSANLVSGILCLMAEFAHLRPVPVMLGLAPMAPTSPSLMAWARRDARSAARPWCRARREGARRRDRAGGVLAVYVIRPDLATPKAPHAYAIFRGNGPSPEQTWSRHCPGLWHWSATHERRAWLAGAPYQPAQRWSVRPNDRTG